MEGRVGSIIWMLVSINVVALFGVLFLAYNAGKDSVPTGGLPITSAFSAPGSTPMFLLIAGVIALAVSILLVVMLGNRVLKPVKEIAEFSENLANGDYKTKAEIDSQDDFGFIAENFNLTAEKAGRAVINQEAQESLQRSVTEFLTIVSQIARGDMTLRGKVTTDALGNVVDSVNYMLDNFTRVLERVRKSAIDVASNANEILLSSEDMSAGATQPDQEITNTSSAVEELTVSMQQVSNNAEASAEAARRALDAAEQGQRPGG